MEKECKNGPQLNKNAERFLNSHNPRELCYIIIIMLHFQYVCKTLCQKGVDAHYYDFSSFSH